MESKFVENFHLIDDAWLPGGTRASQWNMFILGKINIFIWHALVDRFSTRWNLSRKGIILESLLCPVYVSHVESLDHILIKYEVAMDIWHKVFHWVNVIFRG